MPVLILFVVALMALGLGGLLMRKTSPYSRTGGDVYNQRQKRRLVGEILLVAGVLAFLMALLGALIPTHP